MGVDRGGRVGVSDLPDLNASGCGRPLALIWVAAGMVVWVGGMWL